MSHQNSEFKLTSGERFLQAYYLGTPLFLLLDVYFGFNIRLAALDYAPVFKYFYYAGAFGCGIFSFKYPRATSLIALVECLANLFLLIVGIHYIYINTFSEMSLAAMANTGTIPETAINMKMVVNFALSAGILLIGFYRNPVVTKMRMPWRELFRSRRF